MSLCLFTGKSVIEDTGGMVSRLKSALKNADCKNDKAKDGSSNQEENPDLNKNTASESDTDRETMSRNQKG